MMVATSSAASQKAIRGPKKKGSEVLLASNLCSWPAVAYIVMTYVCSEKQDGVNR